MKYICIHGHFYQPPRENPWLEEVETQTSAYPYHDWNDKINSECYAPNAFARFIDGDFVSNYEFMSFDFGPTLLNWLERHSPEVYEKILSADGKSQKRFSGHGSAIAHPYFHVILPLANDLDKRTIVAWGVRDFERRFGRKPEGMWLPEMAVDLKTLEILADFGINFTILSPHQAKRVKYAGKGWQETGGRINPRIPYVCRLPSGREMFILFRDDVISNDVAFGGLAKNGQELAKRLENSVSDSEIVLVAVDGETFGHHTPCGSRELSKCIDVLSGKDNVQLTIPAEYLEHNPPRAEVEIRENTSWSCFHGVERWRRNCGCNTGMHPNWSQEWREPLRKAMEWLNRHLIEIYECFSSEYLKDSWAARDDYIEILADRSPENIEKFFSKHARRRLTQEEKIKVTLLLEMERQAMQMFTSCGWFFDDISDISSIQILSQASRAMQLARQVTGIYLEGSFLEILKEARSNISQFGNGSMIYRNVVLPLKTDLKRVAANFALSFLQSEYPNSFKFYVYRIENKLHNDVQKDGHRLVAGRMKISSEATLEQEELDFVALRSNTMLAWISKAGSWNLDGILELFLENGAGAVISYFRRSGEREHTISELFDEERREMFTRLLDSELLMELRKSLMRLKFVEQGFLSGVRLLWLLALLSELRGAVEKLDFEKARSTLLELRQAGFEPCIEQVSLMRQKLRELIASSDVEKLEKMIDLLDMVRPGVDEWLVRTFAIRKLHTGSSGKEAEILRRILGGGIC
ncbi:MAG: DUF3536 domain-containing protein [Candidatus Hadarchaeales archaeon]